MLGPLSLDLARTGSRGPRDRQRDHELHPDGDGARGRDYGDVLAEAQARGYAEADPTADVEGLDAVNKLVILARLAFGAWIDPAAVSNRPGTTRGRDGAPGHHRRHRGRRRRDGGRRKDAAPPRDGPARRRRRARGVGRTHGGSGRARRSGAATACSTGSRSTPSRWAGWRSRDPAPADPRRRRRSSATWSRSREGSDRPGPGPAPRARAIGARRAAGGVRMRRGAVRRLLPVRGLRRL